ncbi:MAG: hypothetical protein ACLQGJ_07185 [Candidatus Dormibacteria bacterium]
MERSFLARLSGVDVSGRKTYDLVDEPTGDDYRALLVCARSQCNTAVLTIDTGRDLDPAGQEIVDRLSGELRSESRSGGIRLLRYELTPVCIDVLGEASGLFAWRQPGLPENLCLLRQDGSPWIVSIAAERIGYVEFTPFEKLLLGRAAPGLAAVLAHQGARDAVLAAFERRLEDAAEALEADLLVYCRSVVEEGREGVVAAVNAWLQSGELFRIAAAVHVVARMGLTELEAELTRLAEALHRDQLPGPAAYRSSPVLRERWRIRFDRRLQEAIAVLKTIRSG